MMNSTNNSVNSIAEKIRSFYPDVNITMIQNHEIAFDLAEKDVHNSLSFAKISGWDQLSAVSCVDWIKEDKFQIIINVFNWKEGSRVHLRTLIDRNDPWFPTITTIFPGAKYYEREIHEFFGVVFIDNEDAMKPLFLEGWKEIPPYRKDFNSREYSDKNYKSRSYAKSYGETGGEGFERS